MLGQMERYFKQNVPELLLRCPFEQLTSMQLPFKRGALFSMEYLWFYSWSFHSGSRISDV